MKKVMKAVVAIMLMTVLACAEGFANIDGNTMIIEASGSNGSFKGHEYVDLELPSGTLWATCNVGATKPEEFGDYFAWGETKPKNDYSWDTYKYGSYTDFNNVEMYDMSKYCTSLLYGPFCGDNMTQLLPIDDAATVNWSLGWCMPTSEQWVELRKFTTRKWTTRNGVKGILYTGANGNSIFLPAAGWYHENGLIWATEICRYWSNSLDAEHPYNALGYFDNSVDISFGICDRYCGLSVRPVCSKKLGPKPTTNKNTNTNSSSTSSRNFTVNGVSFVMKKVEGGTFQMGSEQGDANKDEKPMHSVTLSSYYIGETEVTQALWKAVMGYEQESGWGGWTNRDGRGDNYPAYYVSWNDAQEFLQKLNEKTGMSFRLPTEAEWEYAARGRKSNGYLYAGSHDIDAVAWYDRSTGAHPVKGKKANELGLYDMSGNVWEWCSDWKGDYSNGAQTNPKGPSSGSEHILRGGSWGFDDDVNCRVSCRYYRDSDTRIPFIGFRLALTNTTKITALQKKATTTNTSVVPSQSFTVKGVAFVMKKVEGGTFKMGATSEQGSDARDDEKPVHSVSLSTYYIGETEVTQALWMAVMGNNPSYDKGDNLPVSFMSWDDIQVFLQKLNQITGKKFRLPTEAEWEFAARGGKKSNKYKYAGSNNSRDVAWHHGNSAGKTHPVKGKNPNELGLYDMSGNVWEWCSDWYDKNYYSSSPSNNPQGPSTGKFRVARGGGDAWGEVLSRVSQRDGNDPSGPKPYGFRLAFTE